MTDEEHWRIIEGYENYMVSNLGNVWSINTETMLSPSINSFGYCYVSLCSDGEIRQISIHRLVARAFIGEITEDLQVNHINHDRSDNRLTNLEIVTCSKNNFDRTKYGPYTFEYVESIPEDSRPFTRYKNHEFNMYYISQGQIFQFIRENRYRVLVIRHYDYDCYNLKDINGKDVKVPISAID